MRAVVLLLAALAPLAAQNVSPFSAPPFAADPSVCTVGQIYYNSALAVDRLCVVSNTWQNLVRSGASSTPGNIPTWTLTHGEVLSPGFPTTTAGPAGGGAAAQGVALTGTGGYMDPTLMPGTVALLTNDGTTGTSILLLAKINASGNAVRASTTDTTVPIFIVTGGAGTTGSAVLAITGPAACLFDAGGVTAGHFVVASTATNGRCMDAGSAFPGSGWVIGQSTQTAGANASALVFLMQGDYASSGGGGGVSSVGLAVLGSAPGFTLTSTTTNPITTTGTVQLGASNENAGLFFAGPCTGAATSPTWRALCFQDLPGGVNNLGTTGGAISFDLSLGAVQTVTLNANATASFTNGVAGKTYGFIVCQNGAGNFTFTWPAGFHGTMTVGNTASLCSGQSFLALNSSTLYAPGPGIINQ